MRNVARQVAGYLPTDRHPAGPGLVVETSKEARALQLEAMVAAVGHCSSHRQLVDVLFAVKGDFGRWTPDKHTFWLLANPGTVIAAGLLIDTGQLIAHVAVKLYFTAKLELLWVVVHFPVCNVVRFIATDGLTFRSQL